MVANVSSGALGCIWVTEIRRADTDALVGTSSASCNSVGFLEPVTLPADGTYVVVVNPNTSSTGGAAVHAYAVVDVGTPITPDGAEVVLDLTVPGRNARLPFAGVQGQRMSALVNVTSGALGCISVTEIRRKDTNVVVGAAASSCGALGWLDPVTLPMTGDYELVVNPGTYVTGTATVTLHDVPPDVTGTLSVDGPPVPVSLGGEGQNALLQFTGVQGQQVTVRVTGNTIGPGAITWVYLLRPNGTVETSAGGWQSSFSLPPRTLQTPGTYTVKVDPPMTAGGGISVQVTNP